MAARKSRASARPANLLRDVAWTFDGPRANDRARFNTRVSRAQGDADAGAWLPDEVVLSSPRLRVEYEGVATAGAGEYTREVVELASDDGCAFTAGELLFKLHNAVVARLRNADHRYFEGLTRTRRPSVDGVPVYRMEQGS